MTTFEELYPGLGGQIGNNNVSPGDTNSGAKWWETLIGQIPEIIGVFVPKPGTGQNPQIITQPQQNLFSTNNLVKLAVVVIVVLLSWKLIQKAL